MLICFAVVLNVGAVMKSPDRVAAPDLTAGPPAMIADASDIAVEAQPVSFAPSDDPNEALVETNPLATLLPGPADAFGRKVFVPVRPQQASADVQPATVRQEPADPIPPPLASIAGVWVPEPGACSARIFRDGLLPTIIHPEGAWAGETFCTFKNPRQLETGWRLTANCSDSREHWATEVRLSLKDDRLTWTSKRGTQLYARCAPELMTASR